MTITAAKQTTAQTPPDWATPGSTVAIVGGYARTVRIAGMAAVERVTATQIVVRTIPKSNERRFRITDLRLVGGASACGSDRLVSLTDPQVTAFQVREATRVAIRPLLNVIDELTVGARIRQSGDPAAALDNMTRIADAANAAVAELTRIVNRQP